MMKKQYLFFYSLLFLFFSLTTLQAQTADKWYKKGKKAYKNESYQKAIGAFTEAIKRDYFLLESVYIYRGNAKNKLGKYSEAIKDYDQAILLNSKDAIAYNNRGNAKNKLGKYSEAIEDYDQAILLNSKNTIAYNNRGYAKYKLGQYAAAIKDYDQAIAIDANYNPYWTYRTDAVAQLKSAKPILTWKTPSKQYSTTTQTQHTLSACIQSGGAITQIQLFVNDKLWTNSNRDFEIRPATILDCAQQYTRTITLNPSNQAYQIELRVSNKGGTTIQKRSIKVEAVKAVEATAEKRLALVVGNSDYGGGNDLENAGNDARDMALALKKMGFTVLERNNLSNKDFEQTVDDFGERLENYDVGLFYYAGHGIDHKNINYLIPTDATLKKEQHTKFDCLPVSRVLINMEAASTNVNIIILDACRNNPFTKRWSRGASSDGLTPTAGPSGSIIVYAADEGEQASDNPSGQNGLFTGELLKYIQMPGLPIEQVIKKTRTSVYEKSGGTQEPASYSKLRNDFYFVW